MTERRIYCRRCGALMVAGSRRPYRYDHDTGAALSEQTFTCLQRSIFRWRHDRYRVREKYLVNFGGDWMGAPSGDGIQSVGEYR